MSTDGIRNQTVATLNGTSTVFLNNATTSAPWNTSTVATQILTCKVPFTVQVLVCVVILACAILLANTTVVFLFLRTRSLRRAPVNIILVSFAFNDILSGVSIGLHSFPYVYLAFADCSAASLMTMMHVGDATYFLSRLTILCCIGHLVLLSSDRVIALFYALRYDGIMTRLRILASVGIIWLLSATTIGIDIGGYKGMTDTKLYFKISDSVTFFFFLIVPCVVLVIQYVAMLSLVNKLMKNCPIPSSKQKLKTNQRAIILYGLMFLSFVLLCMPFFTVRLLLVYEYMTYAQIPPVAGSAIFLMRYLTSVLNPILYAYFKKDYRQTLVRVLRPCMKRIKNLNRPLSQDTTTESIMLETLVDK